MEQKKFRLRLNLFDSVVLALALAVGAFLIWNTMKPKASEEVVPTANSTIRYTVRIQRAISGTGELIRVDDQIADNIKNYVIGRVTAVEAGPHYQRVLDRESRRMVWAEVEGFEDILLTLEAPCEITESAIIVDGAYQIRVGSTVYLRGVGYMGSGPVIAIEEVRQ